MAVCLATLLIPYGLAHEPHTKSEQWPSKETAPKPEDEDAEWAKKMGKEYTSSGLNTTEDGTVDLDFLLPSI